MNSLLVATRSLAMVSRFTETSCMRRKDRITPLLGRRSPLAAGTDLALQSVSPAMLTGEIPPPTGVGNRVSSFDKDYQRYVVGINGDFNFKDNGFISRFGYDTGFVYERFEEQISTRRCPFSLIAEIAAGDFNPFIGQNAPTVGVAPIYDAAGNQLATAPYDNIRAQAAAYLGHSFFRNEFPVRCEDQRALFPNLWNGGVDVAAGYEHRYARRQSAIRCRRRAISSDSTQGLMPKFRQEVNAWFHRIQVPLRHLNDEHSVRQFL